jgi:YVTN family beta-propeller protein
MFDMKTLDTLKRIPVEKDPDAIIYDPYTKSIVACDGHSECASVIDAATGNVKKTVPLGGSPEFAVSDGKGHVFINLEDKSAVVCVDMKGFKVIRRMELAPGEGPTGLAMDKKTHRLFAGCANQKMMVLNADNGKVVTSFPIGAHVDAVVFDPETKCAISSNGEGNLTVVHEITPDKFEVAETVPTQMGARTETLNPKTHDIYLLTSDFGPAPEPTKEHPHPRPSIIPNTFVLLKFGY